MEKALVTVLMTTYNGEKHIHEAIESIVRQTYQNWEFIIVLEYGTTDRTPSIIKSFEDKRIRVICNRERLGISPSLNIGLQEAKGKYIARIDDDDISLPNRLSEQVKTMEKNPKLALCGSNAFIIDENNQYQKIVREPFKNSTIKININVNNCFISSAVMFRKDAIVNRWSYCGTVSEDYLLWLKITRKCQVYNINKELVCYREYAGNRTKAFIKKQEDRDYHIQKKVWQSEKLEFPIDNYFFCEFKGRKELMEREAMLSNLFRKKSGNAYLNKDKVTLLMDLYFAAGMQKKESYRRILSNRETLKARGMTYIGVTSYRIEQKIYEIMDNIKIRIVKGYHV